MLGNHLDKTKLAFLFLLAYPGAPSIYYGDEIGLEGGKDPDCRRAFPWDPAEWKGDLQPWVRTLIAARKARPSLRRGETIRLLAEDGVYVFARILGEEKTVVALNAGGNRRNLELPAGMLNWLDGRMVRSLVDHRPFIVADGKLTVTLEPFSGVWIG
jgi:neopullulanase